MGDYGLKASLGYVARHWKEGERKKKKGNSWDESKEGRKELRKEGGGEGRSEGRREKEGREVGRTKGRTDRQKSS